MTALCESGWTGDRCQLPLGHEGDHDNEVNPMTAATEAHEHIGAAHEPCEDCGEPLEAVVHDDPAEEPLPETLVDAGEALLDAMDDFVRELRRAGARDASDQRVRHFAAYHLADLEGNDNGAGWLASGLLADELRGLVR